jgi:Family of unknown function (DUF6272)
MKSVLQLYQMMKGDHLVLSYSGLLNGELVAALLQLTDAKLKSLNLNLRKKKNIINILIEALQNIYYHSTSEQIDHADGHECTINLLHTDKHFVIVTGNFISYPQRDKLEARMRTLVSLNKQELHQLYLDTLNKGELSVKGGAGLGLLRILRESGQPVEFSFEKVDERYCFFGMRIVVALEAEMAH